jgi:single-strand DNA-binding protein
MSKIRNRVTLIGRLGKDPETTTFESGKKKTAFTLATNDNYRNANGDKVESTEWHNIVMWDKAAEIAEKYAKKGHEVALEGRITTRSYDDDKGEKRYITEIHVNEIVLLTKKESEMA